MAAEKDWDVYILKARRERRVIFATDMERERLRFISEQRRDSLVQMLCGSFERIYFLQTVHGGPIKIGKTSDLMKRLSAIQNACPYELQLLGLLDEGTRLYGVTERQLHDRFVLSRLHGEWFAPDPELLGFIEREVVTIGFTLSEVFAFIQSHRRDL